jgi:signal transduction histidine kinase
VFSQPLGERGVALELDFPEHLPEVRVDPLQLEQALLEIVSNALDAMPQGGHLRIAGSAKELQAEGAMVTLEIADTGSGIPAQVLPSIYQPFFTTRQEGTGLGLAIAKRYVEQNGGSLEISSHPGGTTVRVELPVATRAEATV